MSEERCRKHDAVETGKFSCLFVSVCIHAYIYIDAYYLVFFDAAIIDMRHLCVCRTQQSWRKPHGMDGRFRRHFKGTPKHVKIGYGSNTKTRFLMPDGFYKFRVSNVKELELLLMHNKKYAAGEFSAYMYLFAP